MSDYRTDRPYWCESCARQKDCYGITLRPKCFVPIADRKPRRISEEDAHKDVPCEFVEEQKGADDE